MTSKLSTGTVLLPVGISLVVLGNIVGRSEAEVLGLSSRFWSGFMIGMAIVVLLLSIVQNARKKKPS
nr:hypothetical protein [uncultured Sphingosinicella sp.]